MFFILIAINTIVYVVSTRLLMVGDYMKGNIALAIGIIMTSFVGMMYINKAKLRRIRAESKEDSDNKEQRRRTKNKEEEQRTKIIGKINWTVLGTTVS